LILKKVRQIIPLQENWKLQIKILMENIMSINYNEIYQCNTFLLYPSVYTDKSILSMYTNGITVWKEEMKKKIKMSAYI
jgi:hypothetical protein